MQGAWPRGEIRRKVHLHGGLAKIHCCTQTLIILNVFDKAMMPYLYTGKHIQHRFLSLGNPKSFKDTMKSKSNAKANEVSSLRSVIT